MDLDPRRHLQTVGVLRRAGLLAPTRPDRLLGAGLSALRWGVSPAAGYAACAARHPRAVALVDDRGSLAFEQVERASNAVARGLAAGGIGCGDQVGVLLRNSRDFVEVVVALAKLGAGVVLLNTGFAGPQLADVLDSEEVVAVVTDDDLEPLVAQAAIGRRLVLGRDLERLREGDSSAPPKPRAESRFVILTSGTTGRPKGAARSDAGLGDAVALLAGVPLRARETTVLAAPAFHAWGFAHFSLGLVLGSTLVLRRRFDPEQVLRDVAEQRATALVAVPVMLRRLLELPEEVRRRHDTSSLRVVAVSGSALPGDLAQRFMDAFGDVVYNLYGSTEVAYATCASPADLRAAPGTAGRPLPGTTVALVDEEGRPVAPGRAGRLFVGNGMVFGGYTGGQDKERLGDLVSSGDVGRFDEDGRLFIEGRADDMIVSGGENVFPREVEDVIASHPDVVEAAVVGVDDEDYGARLAAFVVVRPGASLDGDAVRALVRDRLARYKVPRDVTFLDALPRNATGKVLTRELVGP